MKESLKILLYPQDRGDWALSVTESRKKTKIFTLF